MRAENGFTIVEMVITVAVLSVVVAAALGVFVSAQRNERGQEARTRALDEVRGAMARMTKDTRQALVVYTATSSTTKLDMKTVINGVDTDHVVYDVSGTTLRRSIGGGTPIPLVTNLTSSNVFCYDPPVCTLSAPTVPTAIIMLTIQAQPPVKSAKPVSLTTEVQLRNSAA